MRFDSPDMRRALAALGLEESFAEVRSARGADAMRARLEGFQGELKRAYRGAMRRLHPDLNPGEADIDTLLLVKEAVEVLSRLKVRAREAGEVSTRLGRLKVRFR